VAYLKITGVIEMIGCMLYGLLKGVLNFMHCILTGLGRQGKNIMKLQISKISV